MKSHFVHNLRLHNSNLCISFRFSARPRPNLGPARGPLARPLSPGTTMNLDRTFPQLLCISRFQYCRWVVCNISLASLICTGFNNVHILQVPLPLFFPFIIPHTMNHYGICTTLHCVFTLNLCRKLVVNFMLHSTWYTRWIAVFQIQIKAAGVLAWLHIVSTPQLYPKISQEFALWKNSNNQNGPERLNHILGKNSPVRLYVSC